MKIKMLAIGESGSGKTRNSLTFPKVFYIQTGMGESDTFMCIPELRKNLVEMVDLCPESYEDLRVKYDINNNREALFCKAIDKAKAMQKEGKVETLVLDNLTFLAENVWMVIDKYHTQVSKSGAKDTLGMYGDLSRRLNQIVGLELATFKGNVVCNVHLRVEDDKVLEKLPSKTNPLVPDLLGSIRNSIKGHFSLAVYLEHIVRNGRHEYWARTNMGNGKAARSRYPLRDVIQNLSYKTIVEEISKNLKEEGRKV